VGRNYYWLVCDYEGRRTLIYGGGTEEEARQKGLEMLPGIDFKIEALPTRNMASASRMLKGNRLEQTHSLTKATERLRHEKGLGQLRRKIINRRAL